MAVTFVAATAGIMMLSAHGALPRCVDGIYPHLAMFNDEGECGTAARAYWLWDSWQERLAARRE